MNEKGRSVTLYEAVCKWHSKHIGASDLVEASKLHKKLKERYNLKPLEPYERVIKELPFSKERVHIACHDATAMIVDLLTDPRLLDQHYLFHNDNPTSAIPEEFETVADINTGLSYRKTYAMRMTSLRD